MSSFCQIEMSLSGPVFRCDAARALGLSYRQVKRLMARFRRQGVAGLVSGKRGKQSNRRLPAIYTDLVLNLVREHYSDFGPTLAREKLLDARSTCLKRNAASSALLVATVPQRDSLRANNCTVLRFWVPLWAQVCQAREITLTVVVRDPCTRDSRSIG
jgi:Helix-turn-helix domain